MRIIILLSLFLFSTNTTFAQKKHIEQSEPFELVLCAMKKNSTKKLQKAFSQKMLKNDRDDSTWEERLKEAKGKFTTRFGDFKIHDFKYGFDEKTSRLIIYFKEKETFKMAVIKEGKHWKLNEH